jgi:hypothetical protein
MPPHVYVLMTSALTDMEAKRCLPYENCDSVADRTTAPIA